MSRALISVSQDGYTYLSLDGAMSRYSDTGQAMTYLGDYARATDAEVSVTIDDGSQGVDVLIDADGRVVPARSESAQPSAPSADTGSSADAETDADRGSDSDRDSTAPAADKSRPAPADSHTAETPPPAQSTDNGTPAATSANDDPESNDDSTGADTQPIATVDDSPAPAEDYPLGTPYSGPAPPAPATPKPQKSAKHKEKRTRERPPRPKQRRLGRLTVPGLVLIGIAILMIGAFVIPNLVSSNAPDAPRTINSGQQLNPASEVSVETTNDIVPSFENSPTWEAKIPAGASVTASDRGVFVVDKGNLQILDATTGKPRYSAKIDDAPTFVVDTLIDGKPAMLWQIGNSAQALFDGEATPKTYQLPTNARISSAGTSVLVKSGNQLATFTRGGLVEVPTPESGSTPMAVENGELYSADFDGPVVAANIASGQTRDINLEAPADDLRIIKWISAGHGKVIALWGEQGASTNSGHRIQLVVHSLEDGAILSTVTTTTDIVGEMNWVRGQGGQRAYIGPYLFDLEAGLLLMDTSSREINLSEPRGTIVPCTIDNEASCLLAGQNAYRTDTRLLAVTDDGNQAIVDGPDSTIRAYAKRPDSAEK